MKDANGVAAATIAPSPSAPRLCSPARQLPRAKSASPLNSPAPAVSGGTAPYTFSVTGTLPGGLTLNTTTGAITGTPTATGTFTLQVKDANGVVGRRHLPLHHRPAADAHLPGSRTRAKLAWR